MLSIRQQQLAYLHRMVQLLEETHLEQKTDADDVRHFSEFWMREQLRHHVTKSPEEIENEKSLSYYTLGWFLYDLIGSSTGSTASTASTDQDQEGVISDA